MTLLKHTFEDMFVEPRELPPSQLFGEFLDNYLLWPAEKRADVFARDYVKLEDFLLRAYDLFTPGEALLRFMAVLDDEDRRTSKFKLWRMYQGILKAQSVAEIVRGELERDEIDKVVLFTGYKACANLLREGLETVGAMTLYDGTPNIKMSRIVDRFRNRPESRVLIVNTKAADARISVTHACQAIVVEPDWNNHRNAQAAMRLIKIGQNRDCRIRFAGIANELDGKLSRLLKKHARTVVLGPRDPFAV